MHLLHKLNITEREKGKECLEIFNETVFPPMNIFSWK